MILSKNLQYRGVEISPLESDPKEQVSVDLAIGTHFQISGETNWRSIKDGILIKPKTCILIKTKERITMPNNVFGFLSTKGSLGAKGLIIANTKIDPLFDDNLNVPVFNAGIKHIEVKKGQKFCSISFLQTEQSVIGNKARVGLKIQPNENRVLIDLWRDYGAHIITGVVTIIVSIITIVMTR